MAKQILVEVKSSEVASKSGTSARSGKPYQIREQSAYAVFPGKAYPVEIKFSLGDDQAPYEPGLYEIGPDSFFVGNFGQLMIGKLQLEPTTKAANVATVGGKA